MTQFKIMAPLYFLRKPVLLAAFVLLLLLGHTVAQGQEAAFTANVTQGCGSLRVDFKATATGNVHWSWKFGNQNTSIGSDPINKEPSALYTAPGVYDVELTVTTAGGATRTERKQGFIVVHALPVINFSFDKNEGCSPLSVNFSDQSTGGDGAKTKWRWVFGDGNESSQPNPTHIYANSGAKTVFLEVTNEFGCVANDAIGSAIKVQGPKADFKVNNAVFCQVPARVEFTNLSTGDAPLTYTWDFKDGSPITTAQSPAHEYQDDDLFYPELTVKDKNGCSSQKSLPIRTGGEGGLTVVPTKSRICKGEQIGFAVTSDAPITSYLWTFGNNSSSTEENPTVTYSNHGIYRVTLSAQLVGKSCASNVSFPIEVLEDPTPKFTYTTTCDFKVTFTNTSTGASRVQWELDNGFSTSLNSFSRTYPGGGSYAVKLTAYNALGCPKVLEQTITVAAKPVAGFTPGTLQDCVGPSLSGCAPFTVNFVNTSVASGSFTSTWNFGDNTTATTKNATHTYGVGNYTVSLEVRTAQGCTNKVTAQVSVSDVTPTAKFVLSKTEACAKEPINFVDQSTDANFWCWDFGDGQKGNSRNPVHVYEKPGVYTVTLIAKNAGCASTFTIANAITIKDPLVDFEVVKNCLDPYTVSLVNKSVNTHSLHWDFGDTQSATGNVGSHTFTDRRAYTIVLTGRNNTTQCEVKKEILVNIRDVEARFDVDVLKPCKGAPVTFTDQSDDVAAWSWEFGDGKSDTQQNTSTSYDQPGPYTVKLTATDADGCKSAKTVNVEVLNINGNFSYTAASNCTELTCAFTDISTANPPVDEWFWDFGDGATDDKQNPEHVYTAAGNYAVALTLKNAEGTCTFMMHDAVKFTIPEPDFVANKPGNCMDVDIQFTNYSRNSLTYAWDFGDGAQTSVETHPRISYDETGLYDVTLKAKDQFGCEKTLTRPQYISITQPKALFEAQGETTAKCPKLVSTFEDKSEGNIATWWWDSGDGQNSSAQPSISFTYLRPGEFDVTLTVTDINGCTDVMTAPKLINVGGPYGTFSALSAGPFCLSDSVFFAAQATNAVSYEWDFADGLVRTQPEATAAHKYKQTGTFHLGLMLDDGLGCRLPADGTLAIAVLDTAKVDFHFASCIFTGEESAFTVDPPQDDMTYTWTVDGETTGSGKELPTVINTPGNHQVVLTAVNPQGCPSRITYDVAVQGDVVFVPNVFTPNGFDNLNSTFEVVGVERSTWDLKVFNRWGDPVFEQRDYKNDWNAAGLSTGVYYYLLQNNVCPGREYKGVVSVIR
jgi:PKD repeat protein